MLTGAMVVCAVNQVLDFHFVTHPEPDTHMQLTDLLTSQCMACDVELNSKKRVLEQLSELIAAHQKDLTPTEVFENLCARERLGSTGLGHGVAIPHARLKNLGRPVCAFMTLKHGVDFDAVDGRPVDMLCALLVPEKSADEHLELLSILAEMFGDEEYCQELRATHNVAQLREMLSHWHSANLHRSTAAR